MLSYLAAALMWLLGIVWQTSEGRLWPLLVYQAGVVSSMGLGAWMAWPGAASRLPRHWRKGLGLLACMLLAWSSTGWRAQSRMQEHVPLAWLNHPVSAEVRIDGLPQSGAAGTWVDVRVLHWAPDDAQALPAADACCLPRRLSLRMSLPDRDAVRPGQVWRVSVRLHGPDGLSNPGGFDPTLAYFERGVRAIAQAVGKGSPPQRVDEATNVGVWAHVHRWRQDVRTRISQRVHDERTAGVLTGLSIGDQSAIEREDWSVFQRTGVAHLVSISGTHVAMFGWLAAILIRWLWSRWVWGVHRWPASEASRWSAVLFSILYAVVSGWGVPAQRTVWMMCMAATLRSFGRQWPWPLTWAMSAAVLTAIDPWAVRQVGFWLSYVAVGVLMSGGLEWPAGPSQAPARRDSWGLRAWRAFLCMARTQAWVTLALTPLSLVCFQQASLVSLLANLVAIPVFTVLITPLALAGTVWSPCWDLAAWVWRWMMPVLSDLADWPLATWSMPTLPVWAQALLVGAGVLQVLPIPWRWRMGVWPVLVSVLYLPHGLRELSVPPRGQFQLLAADVGQGTAVFIRTASHALLFDSGPRLGQQLNAGDRTLLPMMRALGQSHLDVFMLSHEDSDHVGGAEAILRQTAVVQLHSSLPAEHPLLQQRDVTGRNVPHRACLAGQRWHWDGVDFEVLHPTLADYVRRDEAGSDKETNAMSCVLKVTSGSGQGALLTGDIGQQQEAAILARAQADPETGRSLQSTVLMAPHHGSRTSSSEAFLHAVSPQVVVIQAGVRNRYGHPAADVLARYQSLGLSWADSPHCGTYIWLSDERPARQVPSGATPAVGRCWRDQHRHYWQDALQ